MTATQERLAAGRPAQERLAAGRPAQERLAAGRPAQELTTYRYRALDSNGGVTDGELVSSSESEATARVRRLGLRPVTIESRRRSLWSIDFELRGFGSAVSGEELAVFTRQFATMVGAGVPLLRALQVLVHQTENAELASVLTKVRFDIASGDSLSESVARHPKVFDPLVISMIQAGETAGALDVVLEQLATSLERSTSLRRKIKSALTYPAAVMVMVVLIIVAMMLFVVPVFAGIYEDLDGDLPLPTRALVGVSGIMTGQFPFVLGALMAATWGFRRWIATASGRLRWDGWLLRAPLIGPLVHKSAMARFGRTMAVLTRSGVPVLDTLRITGDNVGNSVVSRAVAELRVAVARGGDIAATMNEHDVFPPMATQLVAVGEETGSLDDMLDVIGDTYEDEVEAGVAGFSSLIEPLLMAVIGVTVGAMVIALYLPMFRIIDLVQ